MQVVAVPPRVREETFVRLLAESPAAGEAREAYRVLVDLGVDPLFALALFWVESRFGTQGVVATYRLRNPGATRTSRTGIGSPVQVPGRGQFWSYPSWVEGFRDLGYRLVDPTFVYARQGATTVQTIIPLWAPTSDGNDPDRYRRSVMSFMERVSLEERVLTVLGAEDVRDDLPRSPTGGPRARRWPKEGIVVHYFGSPVDPGRAWDGLQAAARYHVARDWGAGTRGDGLMYHLAVSPSGAIWLCRDLDQVLWHCGSWPENGSFFSVLVLVGGNQRMAPEQRSSLERLVSFLSESLGIPRDRVLGHQELTPTSCPGTVMEDFVLPYRERRRAEGSGMAEGRFFPETGHFVGHGFWRFWVENGGLPIFGYPLSPELREVCEDGVERTVQYFERAVFEWHEDKPGKPVLLRRLGAAAARAKGLSGPGI